MNPEYKSVETQFRQQLEWFVKEYRTPNELFYLNPGNVIKSGEYHSFIACSAKAVGETAVILGPHTSAVIGPDFDLEISYRGPLDYALVPVGKSFLRFEIYDRSLIATIVTHNIQSNHNVPRKMRGYWLTFDKYVNETPTH